MVQFVFTFLNIFILFIGTYAAVKNLVSSDSRPLTILTSIVILLTGLSFLYYFTLVLNQDFTRLLILLTIINLSHFYFTKNYLTGIFKSKTSIAYDRDNILVLSAVLLLTCYFVLFASKYGGWDAWAIWNVHAKFLYHPELWVQMFSNNLAYSHPDYPLMLPSLVAFFWHSSGNTSPVIPILLAYGFLLIIPLVVYYSLIKQELNLYAFLALMIFVADSNYKLLACAQIADTMLSLFILLVFIQYENLKNSQSNQVYILGFICASCAWVKNEGLVFYIIFTVAFLLVNFRNIQVVKKYFIGLIIPTLVIISFKIFFSPPNDLISANKNGMPSLFSDLLNVNRYLTIFKFAVNTLVDKYMYIMILVFMVFILNRKFFISFPFIVLSILLFAYFLVYLTTPYDLNWHLSTSLNRLFQHVYPALLYIMFLSLKNVKTQFGFTPLSDGSKR